MREKLYTIEIVPCRRWWVTPYIHVLAAVYAMVNMPPNYEKVGAFVAKWGFKYEPKLKEEK